VAQAGTVVRPTHRGSVRKGSAHSERRWISLEDVEHVALHVVEHKGRQIIDPYTRPRGGAWLGWIFVVKEPDPSGGGTRPKHGLDKGQPPSTLSSARIAALPTPYWARSRSAAACFSSHRRIRVSLQPFLRKDITVTSNRVAYHVAGGLAAAKRSRAEGSGLTR
jgi:hypothetical protein